MKKRRCPGPLVLAILDGWGCRDERYGNAIAAASLPHWRRMLAQNAHTRIAASGTDVGLPAGVMGNSEVGHINIGSGRVVAQGVVVINQSLADGGFPENPTLQRCIDHVRSNGTRLHLMGLLSDGSVHSSIEHLFALIDTAAAANIPFVIDVFSDGRDVPPQSIHRYIDALRTHLAAHNAPDAIASICGRFYAMDRDKRWERTNLAYRALAQGQTPHHAATVRQAIDAAYTRGETDEFIVPTIIGTPRSIADGDAIIFFNFRPDRARQLTLAFSHAPFAEFATRAYANLLFATMTKYEEDFPNPVLFGPRPQNHTLGEIVARAGLTQLRLAETEKYAHVTYFFNGGREEIFEREDRELIPSDRSVATYDLAPSMRAPEITQACLRAIASEKYDLIIMNYANADMVGHTGVMNATIESLQVLDLALGQLERAVLDANGILAITADHGNAEEKLDPAGLPLTAHTLNPVPFVLIAREPLGVFAQGGRLGDVAPTLLPLLGLNVPAVMTGRNLLTQTTCACAG
jgi:2,3-bisphosphoglycerate-independent phosphoglycerate mutase